MIAGVVVLSFLPIRSSYWLDECATAWLIQGTVGEIFDKSIVLLQPPVPVFLTAFSAKLFGGGGSRLAAAVGDWVGGGGYAAVPHGERVGGQGGGVAKYCVSCLPALFPFHGGGYSTVSVGTLRCCLRTVLSRTGGANGRESIRLCDGRFNCQLRLKIPHCAGRKFPTPEHQKPPSGAAAGAEPSAAWRRRVLGVAEAAAPEGPAGGMPGAPFADSNPAFLRSFNR